MKLGTYVEISTSVQDDEQASTFYETLGFAHAGYRVVTDGRININLAPPNTPAPMLRYAGSDTTAIAGLDIETQDLGRGLLSFTTPEGLQIMLSPYESRVEMPEGLPMTRPSLAHCGKFGEYALPVSDVEVALAYWQQLGYQQLYAALEPYPHAILSDNLMVIGLHQTSDFNEPHITYFAPDMAANIADLQSKGLQIKAMQPVEGGTVTEAELIGPGEQKFFLFQGEI